ncbi:LysR substrate-binding domain-containing protein [Solirubrobacter ginsenosidimutans]|uniref:LysR substrate-binding domain-containing protein n=1 Tax=Solirubrobacter ginsenosidimutans TaxID=490573 RepID=A0A9X3S4E3_9ACTN|nr:LysR substrate-binding domain-containing protein [Solirubrobacter ginsenosidimutans]MDA0164372.1 LysR substrate-binding domain-containing protein [Solirubrobacter ginsenosidimutans]
MELRHLRVFVTLAEELHFGRTALRLHLTQPSVSGQLRQLEADLGVRLIRRNARQVTLTDVGVGFLRDARRVLEQADAAAGGVRRFQDGVRASLRIGYLCDAVPERFPLALRRTAHGFPPTRVVLSTGEPQKLLEDLRDDLLDVAVVSLPAPVAGLRVTRVGFERAVAAVPSNLDRDDASPLELLAQHTLLTLPRRRNPAFYDALIAALRSAGLPGSLVEVEAASIEPLLMEVACGAGCALVPESVMLRWRAPGVTFRRVAGDTAVGCDMAAVTPDAARTPALSAFIAGLVRERALVAA